MSLLRRLFGGSGSGDSGSGDTGSGDTASPAPSAPELQEAEQAYERELLRAEAERLSSDLIHRQMRYADRSWTPPAQGGETRATLGGGDAASE